MKLFEKIAQPSDSASLFKLVTRPPHIFGEPRSIAPQPGRDQQTERVCITCGLVKITVHPKEGGGYRLWRWGEGGCQFADRVMPECRGLPETIEVKT